MAEDRAPDPSRVYYSGRIEGDERNHNWPIAADLQNEVLGIFQFTDDGDVYRMVLTADQFKRLMRFFNAPASLEPEAEYYEHQSKG